VRAATFVLCAALAGLGAASARADVIDEEARQLATASAYKRRLAAVLILAKHDDGRAVRALAEALRRDREVQIRRVAALGLSKAVTAATPVTARDLALAALAAASADKDRKVRELAARALTSLEPLRRPATARPERPDRPTVYIHLGPGVDLSSQAPRDAVPKLVRAVKGVVAARTPGAATDWPGAPPTQGDLTAAGARAFLVAPTISALTVSKRGRQAEVACTVSVRVAPWSGTDGSETWTAQRAASASGSGKAITTSDPAGIAGGMRDCVLAVAEEVTANEVVPFLRKLIAK
jgi:hypothetical protein